MELLEQAIKLFSLQDYDCRELEGHEGSRNRIFVYSKDGEKKFILRISATGDRTENDYLAEAEFVRYLAKNGASVADVIPSANGKLVEVIDADGGGVPFFISLFEYAKGMLLCDNGYRYREGASLEEYFFNTGKTAEYYGLYRDIYPPSLFEKLYLLGYERRTAASV